MGTQARGDNNSIGVLAGGGWGEKSQPHVGICAAQHRVQPTRFASVAALPYRSRAADAHVGRSPNLG
jgi:hypothetical protein